MIIDEKEKDTNVCQISKIGADPSITTEIVG